MATQTGRAFWGVLQAFDRACESNKDFLKRPEDGYLYCDETEALCQDKSRSRVENV